MQQVYEVRQLMKRECEVAEVIEAEEPERVPNSASGFTAVILCVSARSRYQIRYISFLGRRHSKVDQRYRL